MSNNFNLYTLFYRNQVKYTLNCKRNRGSALTIGTQCFLRRVADSNEWFRPYYWWYWNIRGGRPNQMVYNKLYWICGLPNVTWYREVSIWSWASKLHPALLHWWYYRRKIPDAWTSRIIAAIGYLSIFNFGRQCVEIPNSVGYRS